MPSLHADTVRPSARLPHTGEQRHARERRPALLLLTACLALVTAVALLGAGDALTDPGIAAPRARSASANELLVRDFYAAVNEAIRTGETGALDFMVASGFAWCYPCPGQAPTRAAFKRYLTDLHRTAPGVRLTVESVAAGAEATVMTRVSVSGASVVGEPASWGPVDTLRLAGGLIVERRPGPDALALVDPLLQTRLDRLPPEVTGVVLARLTFAPDSGVERLLSAGPTLLVVESGALSVRIASGGRIVRADGRQTTAGAGLGLATVLQPGEAAIVPPRVRHEFHQYGPRPAVALGATLIFAADELKSPTLLGPEGAPFFPPEGSVRDSAPPSPAVQHLANGDVDAWPGGPVKVALGRAVLAPGARLLPSAEETMLVAVEAGALGMVGGAERTVAAGGGVVQPGGSVQELRNAGSGLLVLLVVTIAADAA